MKNILYAPLGGLLLGIGHLPWRLLYGLADCLYFIIYKVIGYRLGIVGKNLRDCFPERTPEELRAIERQFYRHFADYFVETLKLSSITPEEMRRRMVFHGTEVIDEALAAKQSIVLYAAHYGNWEWLTSVTLWFRPESFARDIILGQVYQPLENEWFDRFFLSLRERFRTRCFTKQSILREMLSQEREGRHMAIGFIADQHPIKGHENYVRMFLNHPTAILTGPEAIARKLNTRAAYFDVRKVKRGHYECTLIPMSDNCGEMPEHRLTDRFVEILENRIKTEPAYWLWTHNRWRRPVTM